MIDSHCHLSAPEFSSDLEAVITRAHVAGVEMMITISDEMSDLEKCREIAEKYDQIYYTIGAHPHHAKHFDLHADIAKLRAELSHPKCRGIGEIGLDYHYMNSPKDTQQRVFEAQLRLAKEMNVPAVIHCRDAVEDVWTIVNSIQPEKLVIHCCTERWEDVKRFTDAGYLLSFTGIVTYPKAEEIRKTVAACPLEQMMVETDAPFLSPVPYRGKRCESAFVIETAKAIARIRGQSVSTVDSVTTATTLSFFGVEG